MLIALPCTAAAFFGAAYFLPSKIEVQRSIHLQQLPEDIYPFLNNPTEWENWSVLNKLNDPSMIHLYGGPMQGKGARLQWSGDRVGSGQLLFTESIESHSLIYKQSDSSDSTTTLGTFILTPNNGGTQLVWRQQAVLKQTPLSKMYGLWHKYKMQQEVEQGLVGLHKLLQSKKIKI